MPLQLLRRLSTQTLPTQLDGQTDIQTLEVLVMAGQAKASVPAKLRTLSGHVQPPATVREITRIGQQTLERFRSE